MYIMCMEYEDVIYSFYRGTAMKLVKERLCLMVVAEIKIDFMLQNI